MQKQPIKPGFVCPSTGRVAVLVKQYANSDLNGDAPAYWYSAQAEEWGLDPWRLVEGVDPHTQAVQWTFALPMGRARRSGR